MVNMGLDALPRECLSHIVSFISPRDACQWSIVSTFMHEAADSDFVWEKFLPSDYREILLKSVSPVKFSCKKDLFRKLSSTPVLMDGGKKTFSLDVSTNNKCYMLSARELSITWANSPLSWCWKSLLNSRFPESVELVMVNWLELHGQINTQLLSPNTRYGAYLVIQLANRVFGLDSLPLKVSVEVGDYKTQGTVRVKSERQRLESEGELQIRGDGWLEIELGEFHSDGSDKMVKLGLKETKGDHLKGGLIVEGIEIRPKF